MRRHIGLTAVLTLMLFSAVAVAARAQEPAERERQRVREVEVRAREAAERSRERRGFVYQLGPGETRIEMRRGRLGITVNLNADAARDSVGAHVVAVEPGGPADRAGVHSGDVVTRMNGTRLAVTDPADADNFESRPGRRLINLASRLEAGDTVRLEVRRDGRTQNFTFVAGQSDMDVVVQRLRTPGGIRELMPGLEEGPFAGRLEPARMRVFSFGPGGASDLELVRVGPELAQGLNIAEGLLVVDVGGDTALGLRAGDVILNIGGRQAGSPPQAMRILSTYEPGEQVQIEVMRNRRRITVSGRLPASDQRWRVRPNNWEFELPLKLNLERFRTAPERMRLELEPLLHRLGPLMEERLRRLPLERRQQVMEGGESLLKVEGRT